MKIALVSPKGRFLSNDKKFIDFWENTKESSGYRYFWSGISSGLLTIASLFPDNDKLKIIDENFEDINFDENFDLVCISAMTQQATRAYEIAKKFKKRGVLVMMGGIHATLFPDEAKQYVDSVFIGEAENNFEDFIKDLKNKEVKPFYKNSLPIDLKKTPIPRFDLLNQDYYKMIWIQTTRGCPINCDFCAASKIFGLKLRHKDIKQVINEIRYVKSIWKTPKINFSDDNMFMDKQYGKELVKEIEKEKILWTAQTDISIANDNEFLSFIRKAGCEILFIGFESVNKENLRKLDRSNWKIKQFDNYPNAIKNIQSYGIGIMGAFIIGFDNDDTSIFNELSDFVINNNIFGAQVTILTPFPGTVLREKLLKENRVLSNNWSNYTGFDVNFIPKKMKPEELQEGLLKIYKCIYSQEVRIKKLKYFKKVYSAMAE